MSSSKITKYYSDICVNNISELWWWNENQSEQGDNLKAALSLKALQIIRSKTNKLQKFHLFPNSIATTSDYLSQVACHFDVVPGIIIELSIDWFDDGLECPGTQIDDERDGPIFQRQVDIVSGLARVQQEAISLPGLKGQRDLIAAALDRVLWQVIAEVLRSTESGHILFSCWNDRRKDKMLISAQRFHLNVF